MTRIAVMDADDFSAYVDAAVEIYIVAMGKPRELVPTRRAITRRHLDYPGVRAVVAFADEGGLIGFTYGYHGSPGQWWHDAVVDAVDDGQAHWLEDSLEVAELHVLPAWQGHGVGRTLLRELCAGASDSTVVLSAIDAETPARNLYRSLGFVDLLTGFAFPGGDEQYAVMGRHLPLDG